MPAQRDEGALSRVLHVAVSVLALFAALSAFAKDPLLVADPAAPLSDAWTHQRFGTGTEFELAVEFEHIWARAE